MCRQVLMSRKALLVPLVALVWGATSLPARAFDPPLPPYTDLFGAIDLTVGFAGLSEYAGADSAHHTLTATFVCHGLKDRTETATASDGNSGSGTSYTYTRQFCVNNLPSDTSTPTLVHFDAGGSGIPATRWDVTDGTIVNVTLPYTLSTRNLRFCLATRLHKHVHNWWYSWVTNSDGDTVRVYNEHDEDTDTYKTTTSAIVTLRRVNAQVVSISDRKAYGQPNLDGELPGDPNADLAHTNFTGWKYRGGLFVGNAKGLDNDQSGVSRIVWSTPNPNPTWTDSFFTYSLLNVGSPTTFGGHANWDGALTVGFYAGNTATVPALTDINWDTAPTYTSGLPAFLAGGTPFLDITNAPQKDMINFVSITSQLFPTMALMVAKDETQPRWRYFGGGTYLPPSPNTYPFNECLPHLWQLIRPTVTTVFDGNHVMLGGTA